MANPHEDNCQGDTADKGPRRVGAGTRGQSISRPHSLSFSSGVRRKLGPLRWSWKFFLPDPPAPLRVSFFSSYSWLCTVRKQAVKCKDLETFRARRVQAPHPFMPKPSPHLPCLPSPGGLGNERAAQVIEERRPWPGPCSLLFTLDAPPEPLSSSPSQSTPRTRSSCTEPTSSHFAANGDLYGHRLCPFLGLYPGTKPR